MDESMEIEASASDQINDLVDYQSEHELQLEADQISDLKTQEIRIVHQEGAQSKQIAKLDDQQMSQLYSSLGVPLEEINKKCSNWRLNVVHIRGVQEMTKNDILELFSDYEPDFIEWVDDLSCNVLFADSRDAATALYGLSAALLLYKSQDNLEGIPNNVEVIDASSIDFPVPPGRWRLGKPHPKAKYLLLRFANNEIIKAANEVYNMCLAHEIAMDKEFKLKKNETPPNSLHKRVDDMMRKVFWELLQNELSESPPNYKRALMLLGEIKGNLMSFLLPQHTRLKQEIEEILDLDLIKQQAENGALDFQRYAHYILSVMARLCAPIRDEKIHELTQARDVVPLFRGIMELLDEMRLDMANFLVQQIRPQVLQQSVTYERKKFTEFLENQTKMGKSDGLKYTKKWLKRNYEEQDFSGESTKEIIDKVLTSSYIQLLVWDESLQEMFPETLLLDEKRIIALRDFLNLNIYVGSALLITVAAFPSVQNLSDLKELIRDHLLVILDEKDDKLSDLETRLESAALQIITDLKKYTDDHVLPEIDSVKEASLKAQIVDLKNENNRIRQIVQRRILEFVESVFTSNTSSPVQMPKGLTALQRSLSSIAGQFIRIASHNRAVYESYYANIITDLIRSK